MVMSLLHQAFSIIVLPAAILVACFIYLLSRTLHRPPGPRGWPLIGNLLDIPRVAEWKAFKQWCTNYGSDIIYLSAARTSIVIIDKYETAVELLGKRSAIYSSRVQMPMMQLMGDWQDFNIPFMGYGDAWRNSRRLLHQSVREQTNYKFYPLIQRGTNRLLQRLLDHPEDFISHIRLMASSVVLQITYGLEIDSHDDPHFVLLQQVAEELIKACQPSAFYVNTFPFLRYIPEWFPGAGFKGYAARWAKITKKAVQGTYEAAKQQIIQGSLSPSIVFDTIRDIGIDELTPEDEYRIMGVALSTYGAGSDTTAATISTFILAMALNRPVQVQAHEEISRQCKPGHLPSFDDKDSFPYITATVLELVRWASTVPTGVPHVLETDDIYNGYHLVAGSIVMANIWSMLHNEEVFPEPDAFKPERFIKDGAINPDILNPLDVSFGFGRRLCPGRFMAFTSLWTAVASILTTFEIGPPEDGSNLVPQFKPAIVLHPVPFRCTIKSRSRETEELIRTLNINFI